MIGFVVDRIEAADSEGAARTVRELRQRYPHWDDDRLVSYLISRKARQTALIGAATAGGSLLPGLGTLLSITVGMAADIGASVKLHAELVLEIAAVHGRVLSPDERRQAVGLAMGISAAQSQLVARGVRAMTTGPGAPLRDAVAGQGRAVPGRRHLSHGQLGHHHRHRAPGGRLPAPPA